MSEPLACSLSAGFSFGDEGSEMTLDATAPPDARPLLDDLFAAL